VGLDSFDDKNDRFAENVGGYAVTVIVYIVCLIYRKAAYRHKMKEKYLQQKYPEKFIQKASGGLKVRKFNRRKAKNSWQSLLNEIINLIKNPFLHLMIFRFFLFFWVFLYFSFQSLVPLFIFWDSLIYRNRVRLLNFMKYLYIPILYAIMFFHYIINIRGLFNKDIFKPSNRRYGFFDYHPPFIHLLFQV
jgi:hypothetical protein